MHFRFDRSLFLLWLFLVIQITVLICYLSFSSTWKVQKRKKLAQPVKFLLNEPEKDIKILSLLGLEKFKTYYNADIDEEIILRSENVKDYFVPINDTICFKYGTDIGYMQRNSDHITQEKGKCECLPGYHSNDCSIPEIIWRAFITSRQQDTVIQKRKGKMRRIIHVFHISHPAQIQLAVIKINELFDTVDLFVISETNKTEYGDSKPFYFKQKLDKGLLKNLQYKILFTPLYVTNKSDLKTPLSSQASLRELAWKKTRSILKTLRDDDDLVVQLDNSEIPNPKALLFFKLFDGFSLPLHFRLKWNVYGYFFQHPNKTVIVTTGFTPKMTMNNMMKNDHTAFVSNTINEGLVVGDLNHYGGWFCDLCFDPNDILNIMQTFREFENLLSKSDGDQVIDVKFLEDSIGDGRYVDGKTELIKNHEGSDLYYSPAFVSNNSWKFDFLLINFYNKIDYN